MFIFLEIIQLNFCGISKDVRFRNNLRSDVDKYMQSFSSEGDNDNIGITLDTGEKVNEMKERNISASSNELESYENE